MIYLDLETTSPVDLKRTGVYPYAEHPEHRVLLYAYAVDDGPVQVDESPTRLLQLLDQLDDTIVAHNAAFDRVNLWQAVPYTQLIAPITRWRCNMVKAYSLSLPGSLDQLAKALGYPEADWKHPEGKKLIQKFCLKRQRPEDHPADWAAFKAYAKQDVELLRKIWRDLPGANHAGIELDLYHLDQAINDRGFQVDLPLVDKLLDLIADESQRLQQAAAQLTQGRVASTTQRDATLAYLRDCGVEVDRLTKADVLTLLEKPDLPDAARRILEVRQQAGKTSAAKYATFKGWACSDHRVRGTIQMNGAARTGRAAGRGVQPQNMPSRGIIDDAEPAIEALWWGDDEVIDTLYPSRMYIASSLLRSVIVAPPGKSFAIADLSAIEGRMVAWLAGCEDTLDVYRSGQCIYKFTASGIYNKPYGQISKDERQIGKVATLALGYGGGVNAFQRMADAYGLKIPDEQAQKIVTQWRKANPTIVEFWAACEKAMQLVVTEQAKEIAVNDLTFALSRDKRFMTIKLPSGRRLCYWQPLFTRGRLSYMGINQHTRKWERVETYSGKLVENATQSASRDVLMYSMLPIEQAGYRIVLHVHDEIVAEIPEDGELSGDGLARLMSVVPDWAPGLPLEAKGFNSKRYKK